MQRARARALGALRAAAGRRCGAPAVPPAAAAPPGGAAGLSIKSERTRWEWMTQQARALRP